MMPQAPELLEPHADRIDKSNLLSVSVKSIRLVAGRLGFYSRLGHTKTLKIVFAAFTPGARQKQKCEGFCVCVVRHVLVRP